MGAGIAALTLLPMGIIFTIVGRRYVTGHRVPAQRLLESGIPGQATVLSVSGGNVVVNNINVLLTFRLRVSVPGRPPYEIDHRQLTSMFSMAALQVGATVPVMVDPTDPRRLDHRRGGRRLGSGRAGAARVGPRDARAGARDRPAQHAVHDGRRHAQHHRGRAATTGVRRERRSAAITDQLARLGISVDPGMIAGGQVTMDATTLDLRPGAQETVLATGRPGSAIIRVISDTGVNVRGESLVRLTLDCHAGRAAPRTRCETGSLIPMPRVPRAVPGATVRVRIDPAQPTNVVIDWTASP